MFADGVGRLDFKGLHEDWQTENCDQRGYGGLASKVEGATVKIQVYDDEDRGQDGGSTFVDGIGRLDFEGDNQTEHSDQRGYGCLQAVCQRR